MNLSKIHHIAIIVSDYEAAKDFYVNKLGFPVIRENYRPQKDDWKLDLRVNDTTELEIFGVKNPPERVTNPEAAGLRHLAFHTSDIEADAAELEDFKLHKAQYMAKDKWGRDVFLAESQYMLQMAQGNYKGLTFHFTSEF